MKIGQAVKKVRKLKGLKQKDFCKSIGVTQSYLSQIENDKRKPSIDLLDRISECFEEPIEFVMWLSITEDQISEDKKEIYRALKPAMDEMVHSIMKDGITL